MKRGINVVGVMPCRYKSTRFPGKSIAKIYGKPMVWHVWNQVKKTKYIDRIIVAVDDNRIYDVCHELGIEAIMTSKQNKTGTDRVAEVAQRVSGDIFVNIQGDEPLIDPKGIDQVVSELINNKKDDIVNAFSLIEDMNELENKNVVKVVTTRDNYALAYSRFPIPYSKQSDSAYKRQIGLYAMRRKAITRFASLPCGYIELSEGVEMFRYLENGYRIKMVEISDKNSIPVDVPDDIKRVELKLKLRKDNK